MEAQELPDFPSLGMDRIVLVRTEGLAEVTKALLLLNSGPVGFDTETRIIFSGPRVKDGPHIAQIATMEHTYVFQLHVKKCREVVAELVNSQTLMKVGFGVKNDLTSLRRALGVVPKNVVDIGKLPELKHNGQPCGLKNAVARVLGKHFDKPKTMIKSNWSRETLTDRQIQYAANDAFASLLVYNEVVRRQQCPK